MKLTKKQLHNKRVQFRILMSRLDTLRQQDNDILYRQGNPPSKDAQRGEILDKMRATLGKMQKIWAEVEGSAD